MKYIESALSTHQVSVDENEGEAFIKLLMPFSKEITLKRREHVSIEPGIMYLVRDGQLAITLHKEDKIIDYAFRYMPIGVLENEFPDIHMDYKAVTTVTLLEVNLRAIESTHILENAFLIRVYSTLKSNMLNALLIAYRERCTTNGYQTIKSLILRYSNEPRKVEGIGNYIIRRTSLSKGYVFSVLSALKDRGVITIEDGKITTINGPLPDYI